MHKVRTVEEAARLVAGRLGGAGVTADRNVRVLVADEATARRAAEGARQALAAAGHAADTRDGPGRGQALVRCGGAGAVFVGVEAVLAALEAVDDVTTVLVVEGLSETVAGLFEGPPATADTVAELLTAATRAGKACWRAVTPGRYLTDVAGASFCVDAAGLCVNGGAGGSWSWAAELFARPGRFVALREAVERSLAGPSPALDVVVARLRELAG